MTPQHRAGTLFVERWIEQLATSFVPRRARTLCAYSAIDELLSLSEGLVRSGGSTRPAIDPDDAGHGVAMLPDVAQEAADLVASDQLLRIRHSKRKQVLHEHLTLFRFKENVTADSIAVLRALSAPLKRDAISDGFDCVNRIIESSPKEHSALCNLCELLVSELRNQGWSDEALLDIGQRARELLAEGHIPAVQHLRDSTTSPQSPFTCYVTVAVPPSLQLQLQDPKLGPTLALVARLPQLERVGRPLKAGFYLRVEVVAPDLHAAAGIAHRRVLSTLGALAVFLAGAHIEVTSDLVAVEESGCLRTVELQERLVEEKRGADEAEQLRIITSAWNASGSRTPDPLHDALRLRHRALLARDSESRLLLLWSSIERMTAGARGYEAALSAAKELVSHAVAFGKLRRDVGDLIGSIQHSLAAAPQLRDRLVALVGVQDAARRHEIDREKVLNLLRGEEATLRQLTELVYEHSPLLAFRAHELWKAFGSGSSDSAGTHIATYFEVSRERVARQVGRIYRARNRIAHVGAGAERVRDLVWHAHFYLTQLTAICVHHTETRHLRAQDVLLERVGQYRAFIRLLRCGDEIALTSRALLRPRLVAG